MSDDVEVVVSTPRLLVRRFAFADAPTFHAYRNDPEVARYQGWSLPYSHDDADALAIVMSRQPLFEAGTWTQLAIATHDAPTAIIGDIGVRVEPVEPTVEVGFTMARDQWGRGYASEALTAVVEHLLAPARGIVRVVAFTDLHNEAAQHVLENAGLRYITQDGDEFVYYRRRQ
jgi:RimJ/RimL family protein N-acetyltransferase